MLLTTLHWPDEIRSTKDLDLPEEDVRVQAGRAQDGGAAGRGDDRRFDPARYKDEYREALLKVIEAKVEGVEIEQPEQVEESANLVDLMKLLEASVKAATDTKAAGPRSRSRWPTHKKAREKRPAARRSRPPRRPTRCSPTRPRKAERPARRRKSA